MLTDDTVHLSQTPALFGTQGSLILDIAIASYSITPFSILFLYFVLKTSQGGAPSHKTVGNVRYSNPLISAFPRARNWGIQKNIGRRSYSIQYGDFSSLLFILLFPTRMPLTFSRPIPYVSDRLHTPPLPPCPPSIVIGTLNIRGGQGFGMAQAIWAS